MKKQNLDVGCVEINKKSRQYIKQVLDSERLSYGPFIKKFEKKFSACYGAKFGIIVNSGTSALRIAIACLKEVHNWKDGDEVIVPAVTFISTPNVIIDQGLKPVFLDVDAKT